MVAVSQQPNSQRQVLRLGRSDRQRFAGLLEQAVASLQQRGNGLSLFLVALLQAQQLQLGNAMTGAGHVGAIFADSGVLLNQFLLDLQRLLVEIDPRLERSQAGLLVAEVAETPGELELVLFGIDRLFLGQTQAEAV